GRATGSSSSGARPLPTRPRGGPRRHIAPLRSRPSGPSRRSTVCASRPSEGLASCLAVHTTRGVIFDMDGVLIDSGAHHREAWRALLDELGVAPAQPDYWRLTIGRPGNEAV